MIASDDDQLRGLHVRLGQHRIQHRQGAVDVGQNRYG
jgi:hypothetical protein